MATFLFILALSATAALLCGQAIWNLPEDHAAQAHRLLLRGTRPAAEQAAALFRKALEGDPASPYRWADLGEAYDESERIAEAGKLFDRAVQLGPSSPPILLRASFHCLRAGQRDKALALASRVLETSDLYDESIFSLYQRFRIPPEEIRAKGLSEGPRPWRSYLKWLMTLDRANDATVVWNVLGEKNWRSEEITTSYLAYLIRRRDYARVPRIWADFAGSRAPNYRRGSVIFDGGFEAARSKSPVDWQIQPEADGVEASCDAAVAKEGGRSLSVHFPGRANVTWSGASQLVVVSPGSYRLRAWMKSDHVTTDHGPQLEVRDADVADRLTVRSEPVRGTHDWSLVDVPFRVNSGTSAVVVSLVRLPSQKFDNKIAGTVWIDGVELVSSSAQ